MRADNRDFACKAIVPSNPAYIQFGLHALLPRGALLVNCAFGCTPPGGRRSRFFVFFVSLVYTIRMHPLFTKADELHEAPGHPAWVDYQLSRNEAGGRRRADDSARSKPGGAKGLNRRKRRERRCAKISSGAEEAARPKPPNGTQRPFLPPSLAVRRLGAGALCWAGDRPPACLRPSGRLSCQPPHAWISRILREIHARPASTRHFVECGTWNRGDGVTLLTL